VAAAAAAAAANKAQHLLQTVIQVLNPKVTDQLDVIPTTAVSQPQSPQLYPQKIRLYL
jgi:hypothetical protein